MNNINDQLNELLSLLKSQEEVIHFNQIEEQLKKNSFINDKINAFRKLQQKHVLYETKNGKVPEEVNIRYENAYNELIDIPIFNEYLNLQNEINDCIQQITTILENEINEGLNRIKE